MGYSISCSDSSFVVVRPRAGLEALKRANRRQPLFDYDDIPEQIERAGSLSRALRACCWDVEIDEGRIVRVFYEGKLLTDFDDLERLFGILAPYVRPGSYLAFQGEEGDRWRYVFRNERLSWVADD